MTTQVQFYRNESRIVLKKEGNELQTSEMNFSSRYSYLMTFFMNLPFTALLIEYKKKYSQKIKNFTLSPILIVLTIHST